MSERQEILNNTALILERAMMRYPELKREYWMLQRAINLLRRPPTKKTPWKQLSLFHG